MSLDLFWALLVFTFVMTFTPGPNTMMLLASGVNFGFRATVPHMAGITLGFGIMTLIVGMGLGEIFRLYPLLYTALGYGGAAYMLFLAWKIATTQSVGEGRGASKPFTFLQAAAFQWVNPKAWVMAVTAITTYSVPAPIHSRCCCSPSCSWRWPCPAARHGSCLARGSDAGSTIRSACASSM